MDYNFDEIVDRRNTKSVKHDFAGRSGKPGYNCIPLWIADMDFRCPPAVREAITARAEHGIYGYSEADDDYFTAVKQWMRVRHGWSVEPHWLVKTEGVLPAVSAAIHVLTKQGDAVMVQTPAYNQFNMLIDYNKRKLVKNALTLRDGRYEVDFEDFERRIVRDNVKLFILCSPHNPVGRVWTDSELARMGGVCLEHGVKIISDEIFADFVYTGRRHSVFAELGREYADVTVTCTAPTKTFNMSGMPVSNIFITNDELRDDFQDELRARGYLGCGVMPLLGCQAAYESGGPWLDALLKYLEGNVALARGFVGERLPEIGWIEPEGTYLLWLDFRGLGFWARELEAFLADEAQILLNSEPGAEGFMRVNVACPRAVLKQALLRLERAVRRRSPVPPVASNDTRNPTS
ncbi:MAG: pyridoxal phosphate-dependent aminotransferase [Oscillospiraceae bacterium]|jgi:cystathionine beta-lyase|nr:pyridoxal phosphate-dependent aminotransferase [Oscillospiraceae bacterium]